jgi:hypothetical protein
MLYFFSKEVYREEGEGNAFDMVLLAGDVGAGMQ